MFLMPGSRARPRIRPTLALNTTYATLDVLAQQNILINGTMETSQANGSNSVTLTSGAVAYILDQWVAFFATTGTLAMAAQQAAPPGFPLFQGLFPNCLQLKATTGQATLGANDRAILFQPIEYARLVHQGYTGVVGSPFGAFPVGGQTLTIGFWVYATAPGVMTVSLQNFNSAVTFLRNVAINGAGSWEWHTCTIQFTGVFGSWNTPNTVSGYLIFCFGSGVNFQGAPDTWNNANVFATPQTSNFFASTNNVVALTGAVALPGAHPLPQATMMATPLARTADAELELCQRYFYNGVSPAVGIVVSSSSVSTYACLHPVQMRATPTITITSPITIYDGTNTAALSTVTSNQSTTRGLDINAGSSQTVLTTNRPCVTLINSGGNIQVDARM